MTVSWKWRKNYIVAISTWIKTVWLLDTMTPRKPVWIAVQGRTCLKVSSVFVLWYLFTIAAQNTLFEVFLSTHWTQMSCTAFLRSRNHRVCQFYENICMNNQSKEERSTVYVVTLRRGHTRTHEQLLLLNYNTQRHAVFFKRYLNYRGWKIVQAMQFCSFVCTPKSLQVRYPHPKCENFNPLSQFSHSLLQGFFSYLAYMY